MEKTSNYIEDHDHPFIKILALLVDKGLRGITWEEFYGVAEQVGYLSKEESKILIDRQNGVSNPNLAINPELQEKLDLLIIFQKDLRSENAGNLTNKVYVSSEQIFNIVDFLELKHAKKNAAEAKVFSKRAIFISALALIVSAVLGWMQLSSKVKIDDTQLKYLHEQNNYSPRLDAIYLKLDSINKKKGALPAK